MAEIITLTIIDLTGKAHDRTMRRSVKFGPLLCHFARQAGLAVHDIRLYNDNGKADSPAYVHPLDTCENLSIDSGHYIWMHLR